MLAERLRLADEERAAFLRLTGPQRAIESETWLRRQIEKALAPLVERIERLERKPAPAAATSKPPQAFIGAIGQLIADELKERDARIVALENKMAQWKYCGVWAEGPCYEVGNFVTHHGSLFTCLWGTQAEPGTVNAWQLCCQRGKNGKDADNVRRLPTQARTYGS
jgi:hypothetical protein